MNQIDRRRADSPLRQRFAEVVQALMQHDPAGLALPESAAYAKVTRELFGNLHRVDSLDHFESAIYDSFWHEFGYFAGPKQRYRAISHHLYTLLQPSAS